jgi:CRP-like cAMP-binding protein
MFDALRKQIEKFVPLNDADWALLLPHLNLKTIKKNTLFSKEGKVGKDIGFVLEGSLRHFYNKDGEEKTTYFYFENSFVCDYISCISHQPGKLSIEALSDCQLIVFPYAALEILYTKSHQWERFGRLVAEYLANGLEDRMVGLLMLSPEERYIQLLQSNKQKILERIPQHLVANYLGITPVSLSRIRNRINKGH